MHHPTDRITHTTAFVTPVVEHWLEREIAQWVHPMKDRADDPSHHERTLLPRVNAPVVTHSLLCNPGDGSPDQHHALRSLALWLIAVPTERETTHVQLVAWCPCSAGINWLDADTNYAIYRPWCVIGECVLRRWVHQKQHNYLHTVSDIDV